jgi:hypothetical protein
MLSAQTNSLGRRYAAAPITDWFNPSTAHQCLCSSEPVISLAAQTAKTIPRQPARHTLSLWRAELICHLLRTR